MKIHLNALGIVNPLGRGKREVARTLFNGSRDGLLLCADLLPDRAVRVGVVPGTLPQVPKRLARFDCRNNRLALAALNEIEGDVARIAERIGSHRVAVVMGTSTSGIAEGEAALAQRVATGRWPEEFRSSRQEIGNLAAFVAEYLELEGPAYTISTACSSSAKVFASAQRLIEAGLCDAAVVGGVDTLCRMTLGGFDSLAGPLEGLLQSVQPQSRRNQYRRRSCDLPDDLRGIGGVAARGWRELRRISC